MNNNSIDYINNNLLAWHLRLSGVVEEYRLDLMLECDAIESLSRYYINGKDYFKYLADMLSLSEDDAKTFKDKWDKSILNHYLSCQDALYTGISLDMEYNWIPVSEREPDTSGIFLVTTISGGYPHIVEAEYLIYEADEYDEAYTEWTESEVVAWRPILKAYGEV